ncbi:hypothetical protein [Gilliamella sp. GillExp13]|uniref:hypothetical protein n=1 Tax=Gilliamella sp. GillExp13 TaxID=3120243 RepID=UPI00080EA9F0|nr:hypothetical protein [Gilliamella apicola]OCG61726.1 hypothetical protein A9G37_01365 [Gilliamella apicola]
MLKSPKTALLVLALLLLSSSWNVQANGKKARAGNRSDAIILPSIFPELSAAINYVRPNVEYGHNNHAGPAFMWRPNKGFLVQSTNPSSYDQNFPTTGGNGLYFDLVITGIDVEELTWKQVTHERITATVTNVVANDRWIPKEDRGKVVARVKLTGPFATTVHSFWTVAPVFKPRLPQTFELVGRHISTGDEVVKYGFVLKQWFVDLGRTRKYTGVTADWCKQAGYKAPRFRDLTNEGATKHKRRPSHAGLPGYVRYIGEGFFSEWGYMHYDNARFKALTYWTEQTDRRGAVDARDGSIWRPNGEYLGRFICVSDFKR